VDIKRWAPANAVLLVAHVAGETEAMATASLAEAAGLDGIDLNADTEYDTL